MYSQCSFKDGGKAILLLPVYTGLPLPAVANPNVSGTLLAIPPPSQTEGEALPDGAATPECVPNPGSVAFSIKDGTLRITVEAENPGH